MKHNISIVLLTVLFSSLMFKTVSALQPSYQSNGASFPADTTIYVDINNDSGIEDGTFTHPYNTIQEGIDAAVSGNVVGVAPGVYYEKVLLKAEVKLMGTEPAITIIDGSGSGTVVTMENASMLTGFTIQHGREYFGAGIVTNGSPTIAKNIIQNNIQIGGGAGAAILINDSSPVIMGNLINGNVSDTQVLGGAITVVNSSSPYIANNIFRNNTGRGAINLTLPEGNHPVVVNNTIVHNVGAGIAINSHVTQLGIVVANNILMGNSTGIQNDSRSTAYLPRFEYNDVYGNSTNYLGMSEQTGVDGNVSTDPMFSTGLHLRHDSPLIDIGSMNYFAISDIDGDSRPFDGNGDGVVISDIGADERILIDNIPPFITVAAIKADGTEYIAGTWTNQTITVKFTCSDDESGIAACPPDQVFETEGVIPLISATASDYAGNSETVSFGSIKIDKTPPVLLVSVSPNPVVVNGYAKLLTNATDKLSGIKPGLMLCYYAYTNTVGAKSTECQVSDNAGNSTITKAEYQVIYGFDGFLSPVIDCVNKSCSSYQISSFDSNSSVSLKFQLKDAYGNLVQPTSEPLWLVPLKIESTPPITFPDNYEFQITSSVYKWKNYQNLYVYDWSTKHLPAHSTWLVGVKLDDGKTYYVFVAVK